MAILQSALVEPLVSRRHTAILRDICHAAQLSEAVNVLEKLQTPNSIRANKVKAEIKTHLMQEIEELLTKVKIPAENREGQPKANTTSPGSKAS